ncbi:FG-GAP-like repeat-containing protein [Paludisphaera borealis]|uniref:Beta-barrel assembly-enhancing protease n=1 Tax=Paludisphaera borealis TaxID=1387353 RepID=A0A1U7CIC8_9BACT|nr:FG-GAP-like repeat-containing protein [Paludisphaera borealis]APW58695.1 Beta-barrel assembly-enhancing protease [Paludisphaera borealis]
MGKRGVRLVLGGVLLAATSAGAVVGWRAYAAGRVRAEVAQARQEMASGLINLARDRLTKLLDGGWSDDGEAALELAHCEMMRGRRDAAFAAWERVPDQSPVAPQAALERGGVLTQAGRFQQAEEVLSPFVFRPSPQRADIRHALLTVLVQEGRQADARRLIERQWDRTTSDERAERMALLREHIALDFEPVDLEVNFGKILDHDPPGDDGARMRLAKAHLAIRAGKLPQAREWLDVNLRDRPVDPIAWRAMLDWAVAAADPAAARSALAHLPASHFTTTEAAALRAWFAGQSGDEAAERAELERLVASEPNRPASWTRLIELARRQADADASARFQKRKAELDAAQDAYLRLHKKDAMAENLGAFAGLAATLGRGFEAWGFCSLILTDDPNNADARATLSALAEPPALAGSPGVTLADALALKESPTVADSTALKPSAARAVPTFVDDAESAGLGSLVFDNGHSPIWQLPEMSSGGVALIDYDGDGWLDVYALQGGRFPPTPGSSSGDRLMRNKGDGTFEDVTVAAGLAAFPRGYSHAVAVGDYDGDGRPDLFVTRWRGYALYRNKGDGTFEDVTVAAGLGGGDRDWPTSAAFADLDNDGDLDLYVCHYGAWDADHPTLCKDPSNTSYASCDPRTISATPDHLFRNDGGVFVDATAEAGIVDREGRGLGVVAADFDDDGKLDLAVANDGTANYLFHNKGGLRFEEVGHDSGFAASADGGYKAGMGIACGDLDGDGRIDLAVTNFYLESTTFYHNMGGGAFADHTSIVGLAAPSRWRLGFGVSFLDADADGRLDLMSANGHVSDLRPLFPHRMSAQLFVGLGGGKLADVSEQAGEPFQRPLVARGLVVGDLDNDGRPDALIVPQNDPLIYLHNTTADPGGFVVFRLEGTRSNRDSVGARVSVRSGGRVQVAARFGGGSFASAGDPRIHFGLGEQTAVESVEVRWPSGVVDRFGPLDAGAGYLLREGEKTARPLPGFGPLPPRVDATINHETKG